MGLLSAFGAPEPVRYETNTTHHSHFRCRLCLRIFDLVSGLQDPADITDPGFSVERVDTQAEGICAECNDYDAGLSAGAHAISQSGPAADTLGAPGRRDRSARRPARTPAARGDPPGPHPRRLRRSRRFRGAPGSRHKSPRQPGRPPSSQRGCRQTPPLFRGGHRQVDWVVDWAFLESSGAPALRSTESIPYGGHRSYIDIANAGSARDLGAIMGANPIPVVAPCHRVTRGIEVPTTFVGGSDRRHWLESHESAARDAPPQ